MRRLLAAALAACLAACGSDRPSAPTQASPTAPTIISTIAQQHLDQLFTIMQNNSIKRLTIDWSSLRSEVFAAAGAAQTIPDTFPAIRLALTRIGDGHSSYRPANGSAVIFVATRPCTGSGGASKPSLPDSIGYVSVGLFAGRRPKPLPSPTRFRRRFAKRIATAWPAGSSICAAMAAATCGR